jgi:hypothetical protein
MIPSRNFDNFPTFASAGSRVPPDNAKYAAGFVPNDTYPAAWANYFLHGATKGISDLNPVVKSLIDECNEVVIRSGQTPNAADNTQLYTAVRSFSKDRINIANDTILTVNADTVARITANSVITITLADSVIVGAFLRVYNTSAYNQNLKARTPDGNNTTVTLLAGSQNTIEWDGAKWISGNAPAVGATFVQYPNEQPPEVVYPCSKWEELDFGGAFFRSSGGNAQAFDNQTTAQSQMLVEHKHTYDGANYASKVLPEGIYRVSDVYALQKTLNTETDLALVGTENRPTNYTIKIYKRIA